MSIGMSNLHGTLKVNVGTLLGRERIRVRRDEMEIQSWFLFFPTGRRRYRMDLVRELRYEEWYDQGGRTCGIRFKYQGETQTLMKAAHESETLRTVVKIIHVYQFSHSFPSTEASGAA